MKPVKFRSDHYYNCRRLDLYTHGRSTIKHKKGDTTRRISNEFYTAYVNYGYTGYAFYLDIADKYLQDLYFRQYIEYLARRRTPLAT